MKEYEVCINDRNKIIYYKGKNIRTPTILNIYQSEINLITSCLKLADIKNYEIKKIQENKKLEIIHTENDCNNKEIIIEELEEIYKEEPKTILERLLRNGEDE